MTSDNGVKLLGCHAVRHTCQLLPAAHVWTCIFPIWHRTHLVYYNVLYFSQPHSLCRVNGWHADTVHWGLEGRPKAGNTNTMPSPHLLLPRIRITRLKFDAVKSLTLKFFIQNRWKFTPFKNFPLYGNWNHNSKICLRLHAWSYWEWHPRV